MIFRARNYGFIHKRSNVYNSHEIYTYKPDSIFLSDGATANDEEIKFTMIVNSEGICGWVLSDNIEEINC